MKNAHRPAFPTNLVWDNKGNMHKVDFLDGGLTKREIFAMAAMQGLISHNGGNFLEDQAERAVFAADALLNELEEEL